MRVALPRLDFTKVRQIQAQDNVEPVPSPSITGVDSQRTKGEEADNILNSGMTNAERKSAHATATSSRPFTSLNQQGLAQTGLLSSGNMDTSISARGSSKPQFSMSVLTSATRANATTRNPSTRAHELLPPPDAALKLLNAEHVTGLGISTHVEPPPMHPSKQTLSVGLADQGDVDDDDEGAWESGALSAKQALKRYSEFLTVFERSEILEYQHVFFVGRAGAPKIQGDESMIDSNFGYDDDRGDYLAVPNDHLDYRYEVLSVLGKGSFGQVLKCYDFQSNQLFAVKVIRNKKQFRKQAMVELKMLSFLMEEDKGDSHHIVRMHGHFSFRNHLFIKFEVLSANLYDFLKKNDFMGLSQNLIRRFAHQILVALKFMKSQGVVHCDLKPENVMLRSSNRSMVKVIDFGSSCLQDEKVYTYIQSRFYRAPEVMLGLPYGTPIDMWSLACILAELHTGIPLFPGEDETEQVQCIMEVLGVPNQRLMASASRSKLFFDEEDFRPHTKASSKGIIHTPGGRSLGDVLSCPECHPFLDFLSRCLVWDPEQRLTPEQALVHPWILEQAVKPLPQQQHLSSYPQAAVAPRVPTVRQEKMQSEAVGTLTSSIAPHTLQSKAYEVGGVSQEYLRSISNAEARGETSIETFVVEAPAPPPSTAQRDTGSKLRISSKGALVPTRAAGQGSFLGIAGGIPNDGRISSQQHSKVSVGKTIQFTAQHKDPAASFEISVVSKPSLPKPSLPHGDPKVQPYTHATSFFTPRPPKTALINSEDSKLQSSPHAASFFTPRPPPAPPAHITTPRKSFLDRFLPMLTPRR
ncbi:hypothetical protein CEUSTIGMA_g5493.t1 [Chlamydomonas eustigma]|uniref:dual-specificity kinase n=1 Tax=Chlamydomonas eustigma TaxID=1157962 RepID=A0A250X4R3_9CHLO|nr:hypothetical protein CEUSTIGMA_g5493.t1 [Chlamydomonas eustigma]|eukprot:GAX78051.1 hypothetical protein CEUSTIGMA_g5493.t1 [Chlamydomonas eustigma]